MKRKGKLPFDPKVFLSKVNGGRAISDYRKDQIVYTQGEPADSVFYIQSGKVKKTVVSEQGKEAVVALLGTGDFFGEGLSFPKIISAHSDGADRKELAW
jgi:CRP/FNR family cyclic AMP-dependent transcriptional regulator